jgi:pimeloyl-ACP methyl ester carboxylesterase
VGVIRSRRSGGAFLAIGVALAAFVQVCSVLSGGTHAVAWAANDVSDCRHVEVPVALSEGGGRDASLAGQVCYPTTKRDGLDGAVQVLVSGTGYGRSYWDFPYQPDTYSYVRAAARAGFTTFNFDRIGIGQSTHPLNTQVTIPSNAYTIHQAIAELRAGTVDGARYGKVVIVGHSLGSLIALYEAATYHDVDAVIASGILHSFDPLGVTKFVATLYPAALDPRFRGHIVDPGYLTTLPGTRGQSFYYLPNTDPRVVDTDEALKETATALEAGGVFQQELPGALRPVTKPACALSPPALCGGVASSVVYGSTRTITVPVLDVVGQYDPLLCGGANSMNRCGNVAAVRQDESAYYTGLARRCLTVAQLPDSGHDVNLGRNAQTWYALANDWTRFTLEQSGAEPRCWSADGQDGGMRFP